jgi:hypothetical protein
VKRHTSVGRNVVRGIVSSFSLLAACRLAHRPPSLAGYRILIESRDSVSEYLATALTRKGFTVRRRVAGGAPPTATLITFTFFGDGPARTPWFAARLADTRSGVVVAAVSVRLDSLGETAAARAQQLADSLAARLSSP